MKPTRCPVGDVLDQLSDEHREDLEAVLANHVSSVIISHWLITARSTPKATTTVVNRHRAQTCACYEEPGDE